MPIQRDFSSYFTAVQNTAEVRDNTKKQSYTVENTFKPLFKNGKAEVIMRFLPSHPNEFKPFIENRTHMYEYEPGKFFGCTCLEKFGISCPICDHNHKLYTCGKYTKEEAKPLRLPNPKRRFVSNVYIVKNDNAPETEGNVYRFEFGIQIMDMIRNAMQGYDDPEEGKVEGYNPFDWKNGANFIYNGVQGAMGPKLDKSKFGKRRPISDKTGRELTEAEIDAIEAKIYTLDEYDKKLDQVWNSDEIRKRFAKKVGYRLFEKFDGTPEAVLPLPDEIPGTTEAVASVTESITNAAQETVQTAAPEVDVYAEAAANATKTVKPTKAKAGKAVAEDDFFDNLEKGEGEEAEA